MRGYLVALLALAAVGCGGGASPFSGIIPPCEFIYQLDDRTEPAFFQAQFNQARGIPDRGRSPLEDFRVTQWDISAVRYVLRQATEIDDFAALGLDPLPLGANGVQTFAEFVRDTPPDDFGRLGSIYLEAFSGLEPDLQRQLMIQSGTVSFLEQTLYLAHLKSRYSTRIAGVYVKQLFSLDSRREYELGCEAGEKNRPSLLDYVISESRACRERGDLFCR